MLPLRAVYIPGGHEFLKNQRSGSIGSGYFRLSCFEVFGKDLAKMNFEYVWYGIVVSRLLFEDKYFFFFLYRNDKQ